MKITNKDVAQKIIDYLHHRITHADIVDWAESIMMEADFDSCDYETLRDIVSRLGLSDVKEFGMSWEDCENFLSRLGYRTQILVSESSTKATAES
jgi:arsenate reductase-like glutaredoxin family protein